MIHSRSGSEGKEGTSQSARTLSTGKPGDGSLPSPDKPLEHLSCWILCLFYKADHCLSFFVSFSAMGDKPADAV